MADAEELLRGVLRRDRAEWPGGTASDEQQFVDAAMRRGVAALVEQQLRSAAALERWPSAVRARLRSVVLAFAAVTAAREDQLRRVIARLVSAGVSAILIKGAAVARTHYPDPMLRPCGDADLLVRPVDVPTCFGALQSIGYVPFNETDGRFVTYQHHFARLDASGAGLIVDLHWKINNPQLFADVLTFDEIEAEAVRVPGLGPGARCAGPVHALFHALVHRVAHGAGDASLLTVSDVHRIASTSPDDDLRRVVTLSIDRRMAAVALSTLRLAREWFATDLPDEVIDDLSGAAASRREPSAEHLRSLRPVDVLRSDLQALGSWRARTRLVREHLLPPPAYMLRAYGLSSRLLLPALYAHRVVSGARKWFQRS